VPDKPPLRFGEMAVALGFCTREDVQRALRAQRHSEQQGKPRVLIGILLVQQGAISTGQLIAVLRQYEEDRDAK
jgi:hypothetical protein